MHKELKKIVDAADELNALWAEVATLWRSSGLPLNKKYSSFEDKNFEDFNSTINEIIEIFSCAGVISSYSLALMLPRVDEINTHLTDAKNCIASLLNEFRSYPNAKLHVCGSTLSSIQGFENGDLVVVINMEHPLSNLDAACARALRAGTWW
jgi:hypothetical protein